MEQFSYYFISTMLHSLWQTALLLLFYSAILLLKPRLAPLHKRNILLSLLLVQVLYSIVTFYFIATNTTQGLFIIIADSIAPLMAQSWLEGNAYFIFISYLLFIGGRTAANCWQWGHFKKGYKKSLLKASLDLRLFTQSKALEFGIGRKVSLWCSHYISTPMTFGFWKPVILLPMALVNQLSLQQTEALIIHELTHIRHKDYLLNWGLIIAETLFFFNPFVRFIAKQIKMEREKNCDVQVLHFKYGNILYAEALLTISQMQHQLSVQVAAVKNKKQLFQRISFFTKPENLQFQQSRRSLVAIGYLCTVMLTLLLAINFTQKKSGKALAPTTQETTGTTTQTVTTETSAVFETSAAISQQEEAVVHKSSAVKARKAAIANRKDLVETAVNLPDEEEVESYAMPASSEEVNVEGKEIIIKDEGSDGKKITAAYYAFLVDGVWNLKPLWLISETKPTIDSLTIKTKDSMLNLIKRVQ